MIKKLMSIKNIRSCFFALFILIFMISTNALCSEIKAQREIIKVAEKKIKEIIIETPDNLLGELGINIDNTHKLKAGHPYRIFNLDVENLSDDEIESNSITNLLEETDTWYVPIMVVNDVETIIVVEKVNNEWAAVIVGYAKLAKKLNHVRKKWSYKNRINLVVAMPNYEELYMLPEIGDDNLTTFKAINYENGDYFREEVNKLSDETDYLQVKTAKSSMRRLKNSFNRMEKISDN